MRSPYNKNLILFAKALRKNTTPQENHLWYDFLRSYTPRFQRQKTIGQFIADFYCEKVRLVIELDGSPEEVTLHASHLQLRLLCAPGAAAPDVHDHRDVVVPAGCVSGRPKQAC